MPRGDHFRIVEDEQILSVFHRDDLSDQLLSPGDVAAKLNRHELEDETITAEAVRQRMAKMDALEKVKLGRDAFWKLKGREITLVTTPAGAAAESTRRGWRHYLTQSIAWVLGEDARKTRAWYDHPDTQLSALPLVFLLRRFIIGVVAGTVAGLTIGGAVMLIAVIVGLTVMVLEGVSWLLRARENNTK